MALLLYAKTALWLSHDYFDAADFDNGNSPTPLVKALSKLVR